MSNLISLTPLKSASAPAWTPASLSPIVWFRMDDFSGSGSSLTLNQKGSFATSATVPGGANAPSIVTNVLNGQNVLRFVVANGEKMTFGTGIVADTNTGHDVILVFQANGAVPAAGFECPFTYATHASRAQTIVLANVATYQPLCWGGGDGAGTDIGVAGYDYSSAFQFLRLRYNGAGQFVNTSNWTGFKNTVSQTIASGAGAINSSAAYNAIGAFSASTPLTFDGDIAEIIVAPTISAGNLTSLASYILSRYGL